MLTLEMAGKELPAGTSYCTPDPLVVAERSSGAHLLSPCSLLLLTSTFLRQNFASTSALALPVRSLNVQISGAPCRDPTYSVARAMAAPVLHVKDACPASVKGASREKTDTSEIQEQTGADELGSSDSFGSDSSSGLDSPREGHHAGKPLCTPNCQYEVSSFVLMTWTESCLL